MGVAIIGIIAFVFLSVFFVPAFGVPGFFYAWLGINVALAIVGIFLLVLQKE